MTKITIKPWEEIVVHETIKRELKELIERRTWYLKGGQLAESLAWAEGVVFMRVGLPPTEEVIKDQMKGIIHFSSIEFAEMPKYRKTIVVSAGKTVPIVNVSETVALKDLATELKKLL
jgi:hypothetical protein